MKRVLYLADPNSVHDLNWISYFTLTSVADAFVICLPHQHKRFLMNPDHQRILADNRFTLMRPIARFSIWRLWDLLSSYIYIQHLLRKERIQIVHIMYGEPNALWSIFRKKFDLPVVITTHGSDILLTIPSFFASNTPHKKLVSYLYKRAIQAADVVTCTSLSQAQTVERLTRRKDVHVVRTGVSLERLASNAGTFPNELMGKRFILFPRYFKPVYNHELALAAIKNLPTKVRSTYSMVFLGAESGYLTYADFIKRQSESIDAEFYFLPKQSQENFLTLLRRASLVVMTPLSDGSPVSAMEAIACGAPVVVGPLHYDPEIFDGHVRRMKSWDAIELAELMTDELSREKTAKKSVNPAIFDRRFQMEKIADIYTRLVSANR
jgi:glycosyltransferase involved in cell wall biosynthesis